MSNYKKEKKEESTKQLPSYDALSSRGEHIISITKSRFTAKPPSNQVGKFNNEFHPITTSIKDFADLVINESPAYCPATFSGLRSNKNWKSQSIFCLDFDDGTVTKEQAINRLQDHGLTPNISYSTYSSTANHPKFRICIFLDQAITDNKERDFIAKALLKLYPESDTACKDAARFFYGGSDAEAYNNQEISYRALLDVLNIINIGNDTTNVNRNVFKSKLWENGESILYNIGNPNSHKIQQHKVTDQSWSDALNSIQVLKNFNDGKWLHHMELFGIATNLCHLNGKLKWMKDKMLQFNESNVGITNNGIDKKYSQNNFNILPYVKHMGYSPMRLENFSSYDQDHEYGTITFSCVYPKGHVEVIKKFDQQTLEAAELQLNHALAEALETDDNDIHIVKLPTGIGKTTRLLGVEQQALIAFPTNALRDEFNEKSDYSYLSTPPTPVFANKYLNNKINYYFSIGAANKVQQIIRAVSRNDKAEYDRSDVLGAKHYLEEMQECINANSTVLTSHKKAIYTDNWKHNAIIFDEDPLSSIVSMDTVKMDVIESLKEFNQDLYQAFENAPYSQYLKTPVLDININALIDELSKLEKGIGNILNLISSNFFIKTRENEKNTIQFVKKNELPANKKIIILSATVPIEIYEMLYGDRVQSIDMSYVEQKGKIIQFTDRSFSKKSIKTHIESISKEVGETPVITYAQEKQKFINPVEGMHFYNCAGYDELKGQDIAVVGTPHLPPHVYFFYALLMGLTIKTTDSIKCHTKIDWKGFRFCFASFENKDLKTIQCSLIESELVQAVGRSRTLRTDATVSLYSNFPLQITTELRKKRTG